MSANGEEAIKFHCVKCGRDFTTFSERDKSRKFALHHIVMDKMTCPHCHASNWRPVRKVSKGRGRGYAGWDTADSPEPNIIVHPDCRSRMCGSINSPEGLQVVCDGCRSVFNCLTGNVDDGDYNAPLTKSIEVQREEAKVVVAKKKRDDELKGLQNLRNMMGKMGFGYAFKKQTWYARFGGTVWKLANNDIEAIRNYTWDTPQTIVIKRTFDNKGVKPIMAKSLLIFEMLIKERA